VAISYRQLTQFSFLFYDWLLVFFCTPIVASQSHIATDGQSVSKSWCRRYILLFDSYGLVFEGCPLWRGDGSVFCICCWHLPAQCRPLPAQSFSRPSPLELATIYYSPRFETSLSSPPTTRRVTVEVFDSASTRVTVASFGVRLLYFFDTDHATQKTQPLYCCRGMLPRRFLANSLGADHIKNSFNFCCIFL
jgi:hypothetical protein